MLMGTLHFLLTSCHLQGTNHEAEYIHGHRGMWGGVVLRWDLQLCLSPGSSEMVSVRKESTTECEEVKGEEEVEEVVLQKAAAAAAPWLCQQRVPTVLLCQLECCSPRDARKPPRQGGSSCQSQSPPARSTPALSHGPHPLELCTAIPDQPRLRTSGPSFCFLVSVFCFCLLVFASPANARLFAIAVPAV